MVREGHLEPALRDRLAARLGPALFPRRAAGVSLVQILTLLGALLLGTGVIYFIAIHWDGVGKWTKLGLILAFLLACHHFGFALAEGQGRRLPRTGRALTFLGVLAFGGAGALVAQIYHLHSDYPHLVLVWWLTSVPFVLLTRSRAILLLAIALFAIWLLVHTGVWLDLRDLDQVETIGTAFSFLGLAFGLLMKGLASLARGTRFAVCEPVFRALGIPAALCGVYALSFRETFLEETAPGAAGIAFVPGALLAAAAAATFLAARFWRPQAPKEDVRDATLLLLVAALLAGSIRWAPGGTFLVANLLLVAALLVLIGRGVARGLPLDINFGIGGFLVVILTRYFEYLADRVDDAVLGFAGSGALLLGLGLILERRRRALIGAARRGAPRQEAP